jgi:predicted permease
MLDGLRQDVKYAVRHLQRSPGFAATALLTLALGIGANAGMFTILNAVVLRPLAISDPDGLIGISGRGPEGQLRLTPIPALDELADGPLQPLCGYNGGVVLAVEADGAPTQAVGALMTSECLSVFRVVPILGRPLHHADTPLHAPGNRVALISHAFWSRMFGSAPDAVGRTIKTEGVELEVIGVLPPGFGGLHADSAVEIFAPFDTISPARPGRRPGASHLLGRLRPGVTLEQASAELDARWPAVLDVILPDTLSTSERQTIGSARPRVERIGTGISFYRDIYARPLTIILGLTGILLLLACLNLGALLLSRLSARNAELSIRQALGASRWRVSRQMLVESLLLSMAGTALAAPVAFAVIRLLASRLPISLVERSVAFTPDAIVFAATALSGLTTGVLMGILPIWIASRREAMARSGSTRTIAGSTSRLARGLLVLQVALSVVMLVSAGLLTRSLYLLQHTDMGVRTEHILTVRAMPLPNGYVGIDNASYYPALIERLRALPGVRSVGLARMFPRMILPLTGSPTSLLDEPNRSVDALKESVSPEFFETVGISLLQGRPLSWTDTAASQQVALVSESLARRLAPNRDIVGRRITHGNAPTDQEVLVVGVVANATMGNPRQADMAVLYRPLLQAGQFANYPSVQLEVAGDPASITDGVRRAFSEGGREYAHSIDDVSAVLEHSPSSERMSATLAGMMAVLAVLLAGIGLYGLLAYAIVRRTREIGIRLAVGASPSGVVRVVLSESLGLTLAGLAIGLPAALLAARVLRTLMFGITETDPLTLVVTVAVFACVGFGAGFIPAMRAASVDPIVALRTE